MCLPFPRAGDVAEGVHGKVELRAAANDRRTDLLVVALPHELHAKHVRVACPLRGGGEMRETERVISQCVYHHREICVVGITP